MSETAVTTLNQIVQNLSEIAVKHRQINAFKFGDPWDFYTSGTTNPVEMWVQVQTASVTRNTITHNFRMWIIDAVRRGELNEIEVQSDTALIAQDVIAQLMNPNYQWAFDLKGTNMLNYFTEHSPYQWAGVYFDFGVKLMYPADRCQIPFTATPTIYPTL